MASSIDDGYEEYYAEKLWERIPALYREEDGLGERPGTLRAIVRLFAAQAALLRRSHDRLWEDTFIDQCDDWAVSYIGELVGTRLIAAPNARGRRIDVAKTIYHRRRKGTLRVLEELIADITGWEGTVVENFRRLARARHGLDPAPARLGARFSGSPPGGCAEMRRPLASTFAAGPFDEFAHTPDVRRQRGLDGTWNIPKLAFHLYRLRSFPVVGGTPFARAGGATFTFDPSGRDVPLFMVRRRFLDWDEWHSALPWELPAPMTCRLLNHAAYLIDDAKIQQLMLDGVPAAAALDLEKIRNVRFRDEARFVARLGELPQGPQLLDPPTLVLVLTRALIEDTGKNALLPDAVALDPPVAPALTAAANLSDWLAVVAGKELLIDPERGRFKLLAAAPTPPTSVKYQYGFPGEIGAGPYDRRAGLVEVPTTILPPGGGAITAAQIPVAGSLQIPDSASYGPVANRNGIMVLHIQAANLERPYLRLDANWTLSGAPGIEATLTLDGLWVGGRGPIGLELGGDFTSVTLRHLTLDPGGVDTNGDPIPAVPLVIAGTIDELVIDGCITGPILLGGGGQVDKITITDSIIQSLQPGAPAIDVSPGVVHMQRVTVLGSAHLERLWASETLITGNADVADTQNGCFRFSAAPAGSRLPHAFESHVLNDTNALFTSHRFGHPGYAQLSEAAPAGLRRGAENGSEIGAWSGLDNPIKLDSLIRKAEEFTPFGLIPIFLLES